MVLGKIKKQPTLPPIEEEPSVIEPPTKSFGGLPLPSPDRVYGPVWAQAAEEANYLAYIYYSSGEDYVPVFPEYQFTYSTYTKTYNEMSPGEQSAFERRLAGAEAVAREGSTAQGSWAAQAPPEVVEPKEPKEPLEVLPEKPEGMAPHIWAKILAQEFPFGYEEPEAAQFPYRPGDAEIVYARIDELEQMLLGDMPVGERIRIEEELAELYRYLPSEVLLEKPGGEYGLAGFELAERERYEEAVARGEEFLGKLGAVFPERDIEEVFEYLTTNPTGFLNDLRVMGWTYHTEALLHQIFPSITSDDLAVLFGEPIEQVLEITNEETGETDTAIFRADGTVWIGGEIIGSIDPDTGEFWPYTNWVQKLFAPFRWFGERVFRADASADFRNEQRERIALEVTDGRTSDWDDLNFFELAEATLSYTFGANPELTIAYMEIPWYMKLGYELPAFIATGGISFAGLRGAIATAAKVGKIPPAAASAANWVLLPPAAVEQAVGTAVGVGLKYGIVWPVHKFVTVAVEPAFRRAFELALDRGLDRWLATQGIRADQANSVIRWFLERHDYWLWQQAVKNITRRRAQRMGMQDTANNAAADTITQIEPLLLQAAKDLGAIKPTPVKPPAVTPPVVPPVTAAAPRFSTEVQAVIDSWRGRIAAGEAFVEATARLEIIRAGGYQLGVGRVDEAIGAIRELVAEVAVTPPVVPPTTTPAVGAAAVKAEQAQYEVIVKDQLDDIQQVLYETTAEIEGLTEWLANDAVAQYRGFVGKRPTSMAMLLKGKARDWPDYLTVKEATFVLQGKTPSKAVIVQTGPHKGKVQAGYIIPEIAEHFGMSEAQFIEHVERIVSTQRRINGLNTDIRVELEREVAIKDTLTKMKLAIPPSRFAPGVKPPAREGLLTGVEPSPASIGAMKDEVAEALFKTSGAQGFYKDIASLRQSLDSLTEAQIRRLHNTYVKGLPRGGTELERAREAADRSGVPWGTIRNAPAYKGMEDVRVAINEEAFTPIKGSPMDLAATSYWKNGDFDDFLRLYPEYSELKLQALSDDVLKNITELEELMTFSSRQIDAINKSRALGEINRSSIKAADQEIANLQRDMRFIRQLMKNLRDGKRITIDEATALSIALRETRGGNLIPAVRKSGFYAAEEFSLSPYIQNVSYISGKFQDSISMLRDIDMGYHSTLADDYIGVCQKYIGWPTQRMHLARDKFVRIGKAEIHENFEKFGMLGLRKKQRDALFEVIQEVSTAEIGLEVAELLKFPAINNLVSRYPVATQEQMVKLAQWIRVHLNDRIDKVNAIRAKRGQTLIKYRQRYLTWMAETNIWGWFGFWKKSPNDLFRNPPMADFIVPDGPWNPTAAAREGGMKKYLLEKNAYKILMNYEGTVAKDIFNTSIVHNAKIYVATLRGLGANNSARLIEDWISESYAGVLPQLTRGVMGVVPRPILRGSYQVRRNLTRAVFPLNWKWNLTIQPSSIALSVLRYGAVNNLMGLGYLFSNSAKDFVRARYSWIIKQSRKGKMAYQDIGGQVAENLKFEGSFIDKAENAGNVLTNFIEDKVTGISIMAAYYRGRQLGFTGRALEEYASNGGALTQSMYNPEDVSAVGRIRPVVTLFPFQTFMIQAMNTTRELSGVSFWRAGAYQTMSAGSATGQATISRRFKMLLEFIACIWAINVVVDKTTGRKPWVMNSFIPFYSVLVGGTDATNPWQWPLPMQYVAEFWRAFESVMKFDSWDRMRKWVVRYHMLGGTQINRMMDGIIALIHGKVTDARGKTLFEVFPDEWLTVIMMGPYTSEAGGEYIKKIRESKGEWYEWFGVPWPERLVPSDEIESNILKLGEPKVDDPDDIYDFGDFVSALRDMRRSMGENRFNKDDNPFIVQFLEAEASRDALELIDLDDRDEWRRTHPEDDAKLALFGFSGRIQSMEAYNLVKRWAAALGISMADLDTWLPPEDIAEHYFSYNEAEDEFGAGSAEAMLIRAENPEFQEWGVGAYDWKPIDKDIRSLRISVEYADLDEYYDACETTASREAVLRSNPAYAEARRLRDAYDMDFPETLIETYVKWYLEDLSGYEDDWFLIEYRDFYSTMLEMGIWKAWDFSKVPTRAVGGLIDQYWALTTANQRRQFRIKHAELDAWFVITQDYKPVDKDWESVAQADIFALPS